MLKRHYIRAIRVYEKRRVGGVVAKKWREKIKKPENSSTIYAICTKGKEVIHFLPLRCARTAMERELKGKGGKQTI